ncbi:MAG TPA: hypothetical protein VK083_19150 [Nocardia sp.]|uniref:hypothetical protein n=1 Tax=Nocardia TaxID=1817 RepID=UPI0024549029|nr:MULTISPECIES: hypothetical protein [Nocardia]HLS78902.1 hypothetical protein [Nocardia sp.]
MVPFDDARRGRERGRPDLDDWYERTTLRLRRCEEPLPGTTLLYDDRPNHRTVEPLELEIAQPLPDVCSQHGLPAPARMPLRAHFFDSRRHPRSPRYARTTWYSKEVAPISTIVVGSWPACGKCLRSARLSRRIAGVLVTMMAVNICALLLVGAAGWLGLWVDELRPLAIPLALGVFPVSVPLVLMLAVKLYSRSVRAIVHFDPIADESFATLQAHPAFRAAVEAER